MASESPLPDHAPRLRTWPALEVARLSSASDLVQAALLDFEIAAVEEASPERWRIFFHDAVQRDHAAKALHEAFSQLDIEPLDVPDEDWAARSQAGIRAITIGRLVIAPPWDRPVDVGRASTPGVDPVVIVIQPSMGFGTGHHATTRLCLQALQDLDLRGLRVIDVGTGSGVLGIAASRLGAADVVAIDDDPDAIQSARENVLLNDGVEVSVQLGDFRSHEVRLEPDTTGRESFDVIVANLTGGLLAAASQDIQRLAARSGRLLLSGLLVDEDSSVMSAFAGWAVERRTVEDGWVCVILTRTV